MSLDFLKKQEGIQETTQDKIGGGSFTLDSGLHEARIDKAYLTNSGSSRLLLLHLSLQLQKVNLIKIQSGLQMVKVKILT